MNSEEIWVPVVGYEGIYEASSLGRVRSIDRIIGGRFRKGQLLAPHEGDRPYYHVVLHNSGIGRTRRVHKIVTEAFLGICPDKYVVDHIDGDTRNNCINNLEYVTISENTVRGHKKPKHLQGVSYNKRMNKWQTEFAIDGKRHFLGTFESSLMANLAYKNAKRNYELSGILPVELQKPSFVRFSKQHNKWYFKKLRGHGKNKKIIEYKSFSTKEEAVSYSIEYCKENGIKSKWN